MRTNWVPGSSRGSGTGSEPFSAQAIRDFHISVPSSPYELRVCVRDHECEDGDRVRVSIDGRTVISTEIGNQWSCQEVALRKGRHETELHALNGTSRKGNCSYDDVNTGEIRVSGRNAQTQSWKHRGGKGSRASLEVPVRWRLRRSRPFRRLPAEYLFWFRGVILLLWRK